VGYTLEKLGPTARRIALFSLVSLFLISYLYFLCKIDVNAFGLGILEAFDLKNWVRYK
jgi:hypothetical protein